MTLKGCAMCGYRYRNCHFLKLARLFIDLLTTENIRALILAGPRTAPNIRPGLKPIVASATATFSVLPAFVTYIWAISTIQKANHILSDLLFLMTVLVFTYLVGLMVHSRGQDASSEEAKMPRCLSGHLGILISIKCPWMEATRNIENNQEPDQICKSQQHTRKIRPFITYIQPKTNENSPEFSHTTAAKTL